MSMKTQARALLLPSDSASAAADAAPLRQRGTALIFSLIMLLILTVIAITAVTTSTLNEKMAGNLRDKELALQSAESAVRSGEAWLRSLQVVDRVPHYATDPGFAPWVRKFGVLGNLAAAPYDLNWWTSTSPVNAFEYGVAGTQELTLIPRDPHYVVEIRDVVDDDLGMGNKYSRSRTEYYRVTGWGVGATDIAQAVVNNHYAVHFNK